MKALDANAAHYIVHRSSVHVLLFDKVGIEMPDIFGEAIERIQDYLLSYRQIYYQHGIFAVTFMPAFALATPLPYDPDARMDELANDDQLPGETDIPSMGNVGIELADAFCAWRAANDEWRSSIPDLPDVWWPVPGALFSGLNHEGTNQAAWYLSDDLIQAVATTPDLYRLIELPLLTVASESTFLPRELQVIEGSVVHRATRPIHMLPPGR